MAGRLERTAVLADAAPSGTSEAMGEAPALGVIMQCPIGVER